MDAHVLLGCYRQLEQRITAVANSDLVSKVMSANTRIPVPVEPMSFEARRAVCLSRVLAKAAKKPNRKRPASPAETRPLRCLGSGWFSTGGLSSPPAKKVKRKEKVQMKDKAAREDEKHFCKLQLGAHPSSLKEAWLRDTGMSLPVMINEWTEEGGLPAMLAELREQTFYAVAVQDLRCCCRSNK
jgi:hypothetical protein